MRYSAPRHLSSLAAPAILLLLMAAGPVSAARGVLESSSEGEDSAVFQPFRAPIILGEEEGTGGSMRQLYEAQLLQEEVQQLRGTIEELQAAIESLKQRQADRYLDLDRRLQELQGQIRSGAAAAGRESRRPEAERPGSARPAESGGGFQSDASEQQRYDQAVGLIRNRQFRMAAEQLRQVIRDYPAGQFTANAYYWLGEVLVASPEPDFAQAKWYFEQLLVLFPDSDKIPDARYKQAVVVHLMGDCDEATQLLRQIQRDYAGRSVARLAERYLKDKLTNCG